MNEPAVYMLSIRQPWSWAVVHGHKDIENRQAITRNPFPFRVLIHTGKKPWGAWEKARETIANLIGREVPYADELTFGAVIGQVDVVGCHRVAPGCCDSGWVIDGARAHWELANAEAFRTPIPCNGFVGLRPAPDAVLAAVETQLEAAR